MYTRLCANDGDPLKHDSRLLQCLRINESGEMIALLLGWCQASRLCQSFAVPVNQKQNKLLRLLVSPQASADKCTDIIYIYIYILAETCALSGS